MKFTIAALAALSVSAQNNVAEESLCKYMSSDDGAQQWDISALAKNPVFDGNGVTPAENRTTMYSVNLGGKPVNINYCKEWCTKKDHCGLVSYDGKWRATNVMDKDSVEPLTDPANKDEVIGVSFTQSSPAECKAKTETTEAVSFSVVNKVLCEKDTQAVDYGVPSSVLGADEQECEMTTTISHIAGCSQCKFNKDKECVTYSREAYSTAEQKKKGIRDVSNASACPGQCAVNEVCVGEDDMEKKCGFTDKELCSIYGGLFVPKVDTKAVEKIEDERAMCLHFEEDLRAEALANAVDA